MKEPSFLFIKTVGVRQCAVVRGDFVKRDVYTSKETYKNTIICVYSDIKCLPVCCQARHQCEKRRICIHQKRPTKLPLFVYIKTLNVCQCAFRQGISVKRDVYTSKQTYKNAIICIHYDIKCLPVCGQARHQCEKRRIHIHQKRPTKVPSFVYITTSSVCQCAVRRGISVKRDV